MSDSVVENDDRIGLDGHGDGRFSVHLGQGKWSAGRGENVDEAEDLDVNADDKALFGDNLHDDDDNADDDGDGDGGDGGGDDGVDRSTDDRDCRAKYGPRVAGIVDDDSEIGTHDDSSADGISSGDDSIEDTDDDEDDDDDDEDDADDGALIRSSHGHDKVTGDTSRFEPSYRSPLDGRERAPATSSRPADGLPSDSARPLRPTTGPSASDGMPRRPARRITSTTRLIERPETTTRWYDPRYVRGFPCCLKYTELFGLLGAGVASVLSRCQKARYIRTASLGSSTALFVSTLVVYFVFLVRLPDKLPRCRHCMLLHSAYCFVSSLLTFVVAIMNGVYTCGKTEFMVVAFSVLSSAIYFAEFVISLIRYKQDQAELARPRTANKVPQLDADLESFGSLFGSSPKTISPSNRAKSPRVYSSGSSGSSSEK